MSFRQVSCGVLLLFMVANGCGLDRPSTRGPGTVQQQRLGASVHDPYADPNLAPEVVGSRPREFQKPYAEPAQIQRNSWWGR